MPSPTASRAALSRYQRLLASHRARTSAGLVAAWDALDDHHEPAIETYTKAVAPLLSGAKAATVAASAAFFAFQLEVPPVAVAAAQVPVEPRLREPFLAAWHAVSVGRTWTDALEVGRSTAEAAGFDFIQSTSRRTGDHVAQASGRRVRWQRSPGASACEWCVQEATQTFRTAEAADYGHERCDCAAIPA